MNFVLYTDNSTIVFSGRTAASFYFLHTPPFCGNQHIIDFSNFLAFKTPFLPYFVPSIIIIIERRLAFQNHISSSCTMSENQDDHLWTIKLQQDIAHMAWRITTKMSHNSKRLVARQLLVEVFRLTLISQTRFHRILIVV